MQNKSPPYDYPWRWRSSTPPPPSPLRTSSGDAVAGVAAAPTASSSLLVNPPDRFGRDLTNVNNTSSLATRKAVFRSSPVTPGRASTPPPLPPPPLFSIDGFTVPPPLLPSDPAHHPPRTTALSLAGEALTGVAYARSRKTAAEGDLAALTAPVKRHRAECGHSSLGSSKEEENRPPSLLRGPTTTHRTPPRVAAPSSSSSSAGVGLSVEPQSHFMTPISSAFLLDPAATTHGADDALPPRQQPRLCSTASASLTRLLRMVEEEGAGEGGGGNEEVSPESLEDVSPITCLDDEMGYSSPTAPMAPEGLLHRDEEDALDVSPFMSKDAYQMFCRACSSALP